MRWSHAGKLIVTVLLVSGYIVLPAYIPARCQVEKEWFNEKMNWFGQGPGVAFRYAVTLLVLLCGVRFVIIRMACCRLDAAAWYVLLIVSLLPAVWLFIDVDWGNEAVSPLGSWIGMPILVLTVPTAVACYDVATATHLPAWEYSVRSFFEVVFLVPVWAYLWVVVGEMLILGWFGF
jgi:hypothetical protein